MRTPPARMRAAGEEVRQPIGRTTLNAWPRARARRSNVIFKGLKNRSAMMNELETHSRPPVGQLRGKPAAKTNVSTQLGKCLVVSTDRAKREMISLAATEAGWDTIVCADEHNAMAAVLRTRFEMAWVDLEVAPDDSRHFVTSASPLRRCRTCCWSSAVTRMTRTKKSGLVNSACGSTCPAFHWITPVRSPCCASKRSWWPAVRELHPRRCQSARRGSIRTPLDGESEGSANTGGLNDEQSKLRS